MKNIAKRFMSLLLAVLMAASLSGMTAFAADDLAEEACTKTEGCTLTDGHEGDCQFADADDSAEETAALIEALPTAEEAAAYEPELELSEDDEGYNDAYNCAVEEYFSELETKVKAARAAYNALSEEGKAALDSALLGKLEELESLFRVNAALLSGEAEQTAKIGEGDAAVYYATLAEAITHAKSGDTVTLLKDVEEGSGIIVEGETQRTLTIDFAGYTYTVTGNFAGSAGTQNQCFQLLKGSDITMKNGTLTGNASSVKMIIQNYADLTLIDMTIDASAGTNSCGYAVSSNCGSVSIEGNTSITARAGGAALDVSYWPSSYQSGTQITIDTTGTITGTIEAGIYGKEGVLDPAESTSTLEIKNVNHVGEITTNCDSSADGKYGVGETLTSAAAVKKPLRK